jgi:hypothetical protein
MTTNTDISPDDIVSVEYSDRPHRFNIVLYAMEGEPKVSCEGLLEDEAVLKATMLRETLLSYPGFSY